MTKTAEKPYPLGPHIAIVGHIRKYPRGGGGQAGYSRQTTARRGDHQVLLIMNGTTKEFANLTSAPADEINAFKVP